MTAIDHEPGQGRDEFEEILASVCRQMDEKIVKEKLEETISYNVSNEKNGMSASFRCLSSGWLLASFPPQ